jgi:dolichol-phosphate mannosyltransferase
VGASEDVVHNARIDRSPEVSLVIPTYNERENIVQVVGRCRVALGETKRTFEIIVVDDDSPDRTWETALALCDCTPELRVIRRIGERGLARAVVRGWQEARGETLAVIDGDLQHPPETLKLLIEALERDGVGIAVASRNVEGGGVSRWHLLRRTISWLATLGATWIIPGTLATIRDPMSGFFALRRSVIAGRVLQPEGYKILLEVLVRGQYHAVEEIPYVFSERARGGSKLGSRQYWEFLRHLLRLSWDSGELARLLTFCVVGTIGVGVNLGIFIALTSKGMEYRVAGALAIGAAMISNFLLNEFWTFTDIAKRTSTVSTRLQRFVMYSAFCAGGAGINLAVLWVLRAYAGVSPLLSHLLGIGAATVWNYGLNANVTWEPRRAERSQQEQPTRAQP